MKKKKQNNIGEFDSNLEFDLCSAAHNLEAEIEPGSRLYVPWLHREFWPNQENEARRNSLEQRTNNGEITFTKQDSFNREGTERKNAIEAVKKP